MTRWSFEIRRNEGVKFGHLDRSSSQSQRFYLFYVTRATFSWNAIFVFDSLF